MHLSIKERISASVDVFTLRLGDHSIAATIWDFPPEAFMAAFIKERNRTFQIEYSGDLIKFAKEVLKPGRNESFWNFYGQSKFKGNPDEKNILQECRDRLRGFRDDDLKRESKQYREKIKRIGKEVKDVREKVQKLISNMDPNREKGKYYYLGYHLRRLEESGKYLKEELDEASLAQRSAKKLMRGEPRRSMSYAVLASNADFDIYRPRGYLNILDLHMDNPFRHLIWLSYPTFRKAEECWRDSGADTEALQIIEKEVDIYKSFNTILKEPFLKHRRDILKEVSEAAMASHFTVASVALFAQIEGILVDLALAVNGKVFNGHVMSLFPDPKNFKQYFSARAKKVIDYLSIELFLFDSKFKYFFWPGFLEYFASDFYAERCKLAHGENYQPSSETDLKKLMLFALTITVIYHTYVKDGKPPIISELYTYS